MTVRYNPFDQNLWSNPWPVYAHLREHDPVYFIEELNAWALTRFEDVWNASMDRDNYTAIYGTSPEPLLLKRSAQPEVFLFMDPPAHRLHRGLIADKYTPNFLATLDADIRGKTREALAPGLREGSFDVYQVASRVALRTIADLIGLGYQEIEKIRRLIDIFYHREPGQIGTTPEGFQAMAEVREYILGLLQKFRETPPDPASHLHAWLHADIANKAMDQEALFFSVVALTITGSDTLPLTVAATLYYLAEHPEQLAAVKADHSLIPSAFAEAARFDQPTNILGRTLSRDLTLRDKQLKQGQAVVFLFASANRDEREFEHADRFDIHRSAKRNLSFGAGIHFCLGQHLARLEGKIILEEIFAAIDDYQVDTANCKRIFGEFLQGFCALPISFTPNKS